MYTDLIPLFNAKGESDLGQYNKSKVLNALIESYLSGKYSLIKQKSTNDYDYDKNIRF